MFWHVRIARARDDHARRAAQPPERMRRDQAVENVGYDSFQGGRCSYNSTSNMPVERPADSHSLARRRSLAAFAGLQMTAVRNEGTMPPERVVSSRTVVLVGMGWLLATGRPIGADGEFCP